MLVGYGVIDRLDVGCLIWGASTGISSTSLPVVEMYLYMRTSREPPSNGFRVGDSTWAAEGLCQFHAVAPTKCCCVRPARFY